MKQDEDSEIAFKSSKSEKEGDSFIPKLKVKTQERNTNKNKRMSQPIPTTTKSDHSSMIIDRNSQQSDKRNQFVDLNTQVYKLQAKEKDKFNTFQLWI